MRSSTLDEHACYQQFFDYGDAEVYDRGLQQLRQDWDDPRAFDRDYL